MSKPVSQRRIVKAGEFIENSAAAAIACREAGLPFPVACALLEKESGGRNVYGHDKGGVLSGYPGKVTKGNFEAFEYEVVKQGRTSNGVGPCQITYRGYFVEMRKEGLKPWSVHDNMLKGFRILATHEKAKGSWRAAGTAYNGSSQYGRDLEALIEKWKKRLAV